MFSDADNAELYDCLNPWNPASWPGDRFYQELVMAPVEARVMARRRPDVEWVEGRAADAAFNGEFDLAVMTGHAFQCLVTDQELRASLAAIRLALHAGGRFAFETRHPQAQAWQDWNPSNAADVTGPAGRPLRVWPEVRSVSGDLVTFTETTADRDGSVLRIDHATLRFLDAPGAVCFSRCGRLPDRGPVRELGPRSCHGGKPGDHHYRQQIAAA